MTRMSKPDQEMLENGALWQIGAAGLLCFVGLSLTTSANEWIVMAGWFIMGFNIFLAGFGAGRYCVYVWG